MVLMNGHHNFIFNVHVLTDRDKGDTNFVLVVEVCEDSDYDADVEDEDTNDVEVIQYQSGGVADYTFCESDYDADDED